MPVYSTQNWFRCQEKEVENGSRFFPMSLRYHSEPVHALARESIFSWESVTDCHTSGAPRSESRYQ